MFIFTLKKHFRMYILHIMCNWILRRKIHFQYQCKPRKHEMHSQAKSNSWLFECLPSTTQLAFRKTVKPGASPRCYGQDIWCAGINERCYFYQVLELYILPFVLMAFCLCYNSFSCLFWGFLCQFLISCQSPRPLKNRVSGDINCMSAQINNALKYFFK